MQKNVKIVFLMGRVSLDIFIFLLVTGYAIAFFNSYGNYAFCVLSVVVYFLTNYLYFKKNKNFSIISFEFLFFLSFFLACIIFPFIYLEGTEFFWISVAFSDIREHSEWRFFDLSLVGYYSYMFALLVTSSKKSTNGHYKSLIFSRSFLNISNFITFLFVLLFFYQGGMSLLNRYTGELEKFINYGGVLNYITIMYTISSAALFINISHERKPGIGSVFDSKNNLFVINSILILPLLMVSGYRSQFLQIFLPLLYLYVLLIKKLSNKRLLLYVAIGFVMMIIIGMTRGGGSAEGGHSIGYYLRDFIIEDAAGAWLVDYTDSNGITGGSNAILQIVSFVPFLGGIVKGIIGEGNIALSSSLAFTYAYDTNGTGLGTNLIGDLYYSFGFVGVVILMFLLGFVIRKLSNHGGLYTLVCYLLMLGNSVFSTRVEYFYMVRNLGFSVIIIWMITQLEGKPHKRHN